jgi:cytidyltransferase-like protein
MHFQLATSEHWGYLHKDAMPPFSGTRKFFDFSDKNWEGKTRLEGMIEGGEGSMAQDISTFILESKNTYPNKENYSLLGPNSNTYISWVLTQFPGWNVRIPWNAFGAGKSEGKKIGTGIVHGRFQPPHNGHIRYIVEALNNCNHLYIGICRPVLCTPEESAKTGYPCTPALNPFTFDERADLITASLDAISIKRNRYTIIPFPSNYKNLDDILLQNTVFLMSVTGGGDKAKINFIKSLGYKVKTIMNVPENHERERSGTVRDTAHTETIEWEKIVPRPVADYIKRPEITERLRSLGIPTDVVR